MPELSFHEQNFLYGVNPEAIIERERILPEFCEPASNKKWKREFE